MLDARKNIDLIKDIDEISEKEFKHLGYYMMNPGTQIFTILY